MFHIVLNANENYIKYAAVLMTSIIQKTDLNKSMSEFCNFDTDEGYVFHILSDFISESMKVRISNLEKQLNDIYPCKIVLHILNDDEFKGMLKWRGNYLAYYRIKMASVLPQNLKICLYLDCDMLCFGDLRELLSVDINNYQAAVCLDGNNHKKNKKVFFSLKGREKYKFSNIEKYFNSGFILVNLDRWRRDNIENKSIDFLKKFKTLYPDQDALNIALTEVLTLPMRWNLLLSYVVANVNNSKKLFRDQSKYSSLHYTQYEFKTELNNIKIAHFIVEPSKPWDKLSYGIFGDNLENIPYPFYKEYWLAAKNTPEFSLELMQIKEDIENSQIESLVNGLGKRVEKEFKLYTLRTSYRKLRKAIVFLYIINIIFIAYVIYFK
ncbi:glycosyltransferase family 8 protein [Campylobacter jejuni]|uniref:glycosyltransferase family 8 protein n=1 Tax=Campylobacter jejuni TaxID=197 RepID=UPI0008734F14|nr:glycosyltransferase family 8 protein [Campylobacter jejuni]EJJ1716345.1 glycosyltransferase family 8 protein [Campylobacter jejuni]EKQ1038353.1 glycosyltransferase family 8 protein [Campylobacter jejuni]OEV52789.1 glycosyl transferase [Campylobacter jejuni]HAA1629000.1 glycosyltransferase family 8 protein [Campylobacter jejuni]HAA1632657.1 glycosyltransferase family 8 protein [Campylobacter jejuni]